MSKFSTTMESAIDETEGNNDAAQATEKKKKKRKKSADDSGNEHGEMRTMGVNDRVVDDTRASQRLRDGSSGENSNTNKRRGERARPRSLKDCCKSYWISGFPDDEDEDEDAPPTCLRGTFKMFRDNPLFLLLVLVPIAVGLGLSKANDVATFVFSLLALIPLAKMIGTATEDIALRTGSVIGSLLNATFGNATELIVALVALFNGNFLVVKTSLLGSVLSNVLLVLGMSFALGGVRNTEQLFHASGAQNSGHLLLIASFAIILPVVFLQDQNTDVANDATGNMTHELRVSRGTSVILLITYISFLVFQLKTHKIYFEDIETSDDDSDEEKPLLPIWGGVLTLTVATGFVAWVSEYLVDSLTVFVEATGISEVFIGVILFPIAGNAAEHVSALTCAWKNKIGISVQISTLVLPLMVVIGWIAGLQMDLLFGTYQSVCLILAVMIANATMVDGKSNWLEGLLLVCVYVVMAVGFFFSSPPPNSGPVV